MPVIKRYANRKLYDTDAKRYITLDGIAELIRQGVETHIVDHESGEDITAQIQAQIIFEQEKKIGGVLPRSLFTDLIQTGNNTLNQFRHVLSANDFGAHVEAEIERRVKALVAHGTLTEAEGQRWLTALQSVAPPDAEARALSDSDLERALKQRKVPSRAELEQLAHQLEALTGELEQIKKRRA